MTEQLGRDHSTQPLGSAEMKPNGGAKSGVDHQHGEPESGGETAKLKSQENAFSIIDDAAYHGLAGEIVRLSLPIPRQILSPFSFSG